MMKQTTMFFFFFHTYIYYPTDPCHIITNKKKKYNGIDNIPDELDSDQGGLRERNAQ